MKPLPSTALLIAGKVGAAMFKIKSFAIHLPYFSILTTKERYNDNNNDDNDSKPTGHWLSSLKKEQWMTNRPNFDTKARDRKSNTDNTTLLSCAQYVPNNVPTRGCPIGQKSGLTDALVYCHRFRPFGIKRGLRIFWVDMLQGDLFGDMFFVICCLFLCVWLFICFFVSSHSYVPCSIVAPVLVDTVLCYRGMCLFICSRLFVGFIWIYLICSGRRVLDCCLDAFCICLEALSCHFWGWLFWRHVGKSNEFVKEQTFARESSACWTYNINIIRFIQW